MEKIEQDHYEILELSYEASQEEIGQAFRRLAKIYHPDKWKGGKDGNIDSTERFIKIETAYKTLKNETTKAEFDQLIRQHIQRQKKHAQESADRRKGRIELAKREEAAEAAKQEYYNTKNAAYQQRYSQKKTRRRNR
eukprot:TRINITY_DN15168_c0_g1_i1.p1 TRINITY_DN15168_c0_g1~~TRINITY_DN15168_c0_g1_i1.p1  ORF type:complete len:137 (-),score=47.75 TRINITY_DN15168_c0_g1_i1:19-429(-)